MSGYLLAQLGVRVNNFIIDRVDLLGLHAQDIMLNDGAIGIGSVTLNYTPWGLAAGRINSAIILRPHVGIITKSGQIMIGGETLPAQSLSPTSSTTPLRWRIVSLKIVDADISVDAPSGQTHAVFSTDLALAGTDIQHAALDLDVNVPFGSSQHRLHITVPTLEVTSHGGGITLSFAQAKIVPTNIPWIADDLNGKINWLPGRLTAKLASLRVTNTQSPARSLPINLAGDATMHGPKIDFNLHAAMSPSRHPEMLQVDATGTHDFTTNQGTLRVTSIPITFKANDLQPSEFLPTLSATLPKITGTISLDGTASWRDAIISPALVLHLSNGGAEVQGVRFSNLRGDIAVTSLAPLATAARQSLQGTIEAGGMPPSQAHLIFQLLAKPSLRVDALGMDLFSGEVVASPFTIDPVHPDFETMVGFKQVDLTEFFKLLSVDGLGGSGKLDGQIPLQFTQRKIIVHDGTLTATGPGILRLRTDALPKQITDAGQSLDLVLKALADFHYDKLTVELTGNVAGDGTIMLKIQGNNPAVLEGRPFNLNIRLETNFDRLIDLALRSMQATQELLRQTIGSTRR